jgi:hypothetical protein
LLAVGGMVVAVIGLLLAPLVPPVFISRVRVPPGADRVETAAGLRYRAGFIQRFFQGNHYRELWTTPIVVPVLALDHGTGGLRPTREGGGMQTRSLRLVGPEGKSYLFRSTDKELSRLISHNLGRSLVAHILQDQTKSSHPAAALIVAPLQARLGLPAGHPELVVIPDDSALGGFRSRFAGLLGVLQEDPADGPQFKDTDEVLALAAGDPSQVLDQNTYLVARLFDFFLNDWDRHPKQWRWRAEEIEGRRVWHPIPVDRDQAFSWYDGFLMELARLRSPKLAKFGPTYPPARGLARNAAPLDAALLADLDQAVWDSAAEFVRLRLTDEAIEEAVRRMPEPYWRVQGQWMVEVLKARRDRLPEAARSFRRFVLSRVDRGG